VGREPAGGKEGGRGGMRRGRRTVEGGGARK
jgi:hypothetical protein